MVLIIMSKTGRGVGRTNDKVFPFVEFIVRTLTKATTVFNW